MRYLVREGAAVSCVFLFLYYHVELCFWLAGALGIGFVHYGVKDAWRGVVRACVVKGKGKASLQIRVSRIMSQFHVTSPGFGTTLAFK
jgi:hypothetical protein